MNEQEIYENLCMAQHYLSKLDPFSLMGVACQLLDIVSAELNFTDKRELIEKVYLQGNEKAERIQTSIECAKDFRSRDWIAESKNDGGDYIC